MENITNSINNVSTTRFALALMVLWSHSFAFYFNNEKLEPVSILTRGLYNAGNIAVACFLILSGALVLRSFETSRSHWQFVKKRAVRLYPAYMVALFVCAFIVSPIYSGSNAYALLKSEFLKWMLMNALFRGYIPIDGIFKTSDIAAVNGSLWSITYEVFCYFGLVGAALIFKRSLNLICTTIFLISVAAKSYADIFGWNPGFGIIGFIFGWPYLWFSVAGWFVTGMLYYLNRRHIPRSPQIAFILVSCLAASIWLSPNSAISRFLTNIIYTPSIGYVLFFICSMRMQKAEILCRNYDLSYGVYLYAFPIQQIVMAEFGKSLSFTGYIASSLLVTAFVALLSWRFVEKPFLQKT